jgi:hypothetical protein
LRVRIYHPWRRGDFLLDDPVEIGWAAIPSTASTDSASTSWPWSSPVVEADEHVAPRGRRCVGLALDLHLIDARSDMPPRRLSMVIRCLVVVA